MSIFPGGIASFLGFTSGHTLSVDQHAAQHNSEQAEIIATQTKIGTGSSTPTSGVVLRGTGVGTSQWGQVNLMSDITGVLPQANGGTGRTDATGTGPPVYQTSPTIITPILTAPTISDFTNANHDHSSTSKGGSLGASTVGSSQIIDNSIVFNDLLSTIFSGQVQTQVNAGTAGGTLWWINLGGLKILWGLSALKANSTGGVQYTFTLPSFFTTVQTGIPAITNLDTNGGQFAAMETLTTASVAVDITAITGTPNAKIGILIIGT